MGNRSQDLLNEFLQEQGARLASQSAERLIFFSGLEENIQQFLDAVRKFNETGEVNSEVLQIDLKKDPERGPAKRGGRRKKNQKDVIPETSEPASARTSTSSTASSLIAKENIKVEKEDMPAPNWLPPKRKVKEIKTERASVRTTRTKGRKAATRDSDVIIENPKISVINLVDTDNSETDKESTMRSTRSKARKQLQQIDVNTESARSTRTKTRKQAKEVNEETKENASAKRLSPDSMNEEEISNNKKAKKDKLVPPVENKQIDTTGKTQYEDAQSTLGPLQDSQQLNSTYVASNPMEPTSLAPKIIVTSEPQVNSTVIIEKPKFNIFDKKSNNDLFTDDESSMELNTSPKKAPIPKSATKQIFSPYAKTTLKKKVEAFEKLHNGSEIPVMVGKGARDTPSSAKGKTKMFTPLRMKFVPSGSSTTKVSKFLSAQSHNSLLQNDSILTSKSAQKDLREHQKKLQEREEAIKKKEAMLLAQSEARRKQNEDKQLKAQQQRKALEAERLRQLEIQKQKEEKMRQRELEREESLQKQKQELERKKLAQKKKIQEIQAQKQLLLIEQPKDRPIYMTTQAPPLPTEDCYDSDDSNYRKVPDPSWCTGEKSKIMQLSMLTAGEKIKNTLFCRRAQTPDLKDIFEMIDPRKLKRNSSMFWKKPPRYTMMPDLNETRFSEDEELYESD